jgi:hypothetical protein
LRASRHDARRLCGAAGPAGFDHPLQLGRQLFAYATWREQPYGLGARQLAHRPWSPVELREHPHDSLREGLDVSRCDLADDGPIDALDRADLARRDDRYPSGKRLADGEAERLILARLQQQIGLRELGRNLRGSDATDEL